MTSVNFWQGDLVTWTSQSAGVSKTKTGVVEEVVAPNCKPNRNAFAQLYKGAGVGMQRDHTSYVVRLPGKTTKSAGKLYWPRVNALSKTDRRTTKDFDTSMREAMSCEK